MATELPPFRRIANEVRDSILAGHYAPGDRLPSENELAEQHTTTRTTVRKAIALLRSEGLVASEQGRGAFVRPRPHLRLLQTGANYRARRSTGVGNFNAEAQAQGHRAKQLLRSVVETEPPGDIAERLEVAPNAPVIVRNLLFTVDDEPMQLCDAYYPAELFRGTRIAERRVIKGGAHSVIEDPSGPIRTRVTQFVEDLDIRMPVPAESEALAIPEGIPVVRALRTAHDSHGRALEVLESILPADRYTFRYVIDVS